MPRRKSGKKRKSRGKGALGPNLMGKTIRVPFRNCFYCVLSEVKGFNVYNLNIGFETPGFFGDVATQVATGYERFRCTKLRIKARPPRVSEQQNTNCSFQAGIGYSMFGASGAPGGFSSMCQMDSFALGSGANETCSMTLNRKTLMGQTELKWYFVKAHSTEAVSELYQALYGMLRGLTLTSTPSGESGLRSMGSSNSVTLSSPQFWSGTMRQCVLLPIEKTLRSLILLATTTTSRWLITGWLPVIS